MPNINWAKQIAYEGNVSIPGGEGWSRAYDLALFEDASDNKALVLLVTIILDFTFKSGDGGMWTTADKNDFTKNLKTECENAWSDQFEIKEGMCRDPEPGPVPRTLARVVILIKTGEDMAPWKSHWSITAHKVKAPIWNFVRDKNDVRFESTGLDLAVPKNGTKPRRTIVHEFGHFLGYRDEYKDSDRGTGAYLGESDSMMNLGDVVKERHYVFFSDWISKKLGSPWLVEGRRNLNNTPL